MFRQWSKHFPDFSSEKSSDAGREARQKLNRALLFGGLLLVVSIAAPFLLSDPELPDESTDTSSEEVSSAVRDRTPAPANPSPIDLSSPGVIVAILLLAGGIGLALYLRTGDPPSSAPSTVFIPVAEHQLSPHQKLQLVRCADELLLLAISSESVDLLKTYPPEALSAHGDGHLHPEDAPQPAVNGSNALPFAAVLQKYAARHTSLYRT